ncbi:HlyD family secretion protein [Stygiobacter electus]|uniref:HlyD family efflux transporter periplasmic adaptor subunit n=1 Tax=Stygiobacter electus TaxID=3032292 RepID=A0AAE3P2E8_9BACT|nr:HlyD family efflux transporter periplasmic adaptor subunit [Stygiobacter electus]MDF1611605.1 HlyD family efflux transporter periplasmic adaptor subunit [Stygiobacter electus]
MKNLISIFLLMFIFLFACSNDNNNYDATGTFEAEEYIISSEANGKILKLNFDEGDTLYKNQNVGLIDTTQLFLKKEQLYATINSLKNKLPDVETQLSTIEEQITAAEREKKRIEALAQSNSVSTKQLDDITSQLEVLKKQYNATKSNLTISQKSILSEINPIKTQIEQTNDLIKKSIIVNPIDGIVLVRYSKQDEITAQGKALYKIANLSEMTLRAFVSGNQLSNIKLGQKVKVYIDEGENQKEYEGKIYWISSKAEFTPKTIQTKDERVNLVYAIKIKVKNDGFLKIGMYGEVKF